MRKNIAVLLVFAVTLLILSGCGRGLFKERMSDDETIELFEIQCGKILEISNDLAGLITHYQGSMLSMSKESNAKEFETMHKDIQQEVQEISRDFRESLPSEKYEKLWNDLTSCTDALSDTFGLCTDLDTNNDENYTNEEIFETFSQMMGQAQANLDEFLEIVVEFRALYE